MCTTKTYLLPGIALVLLLTGCGTKTEGPVRRAVEGSVSYNSQPLDYGEIRFLPEPEGPITIAIISDGKYELPSPSGVPLGMVQVQINSLTRPAELTLDGDLPSKGGRKVVDIPKKYNTETQLSAEIPSGNGSFTLDFNLPESRS